MKVLISPAKSLDFDPHPLSLPTSTPSFPKETQSLINNLKRQSKKSIGKMMSISKALVDLNVDRYNSYVPEFTSENSKAAILAFAGDVYVGMDAKSFNDKDLIFANDSIRILSGLYGILHPLDRIQPYRLEMGTSLKVGRKKNLVHFWKENVTTFLNKEFAQSGDNILVNLASKEYFNAIDLKKIKADIYTCEFKENHGGQLKFISFNAKKARGMMCRYIVKNQITNAEDLIGFDSDGYRFASEHSDDKNFMFTK